MLTPHTKPPFTIQVPVHHGLPEPGVDGEREPGAVHVGALRDRVVGRLAGAHHGDALASDQLGGGSGGHARVVHGVEHLPPEHLGASVRRERRRVRHSAELAEAQYQEVKPVHLHQKKNAVSL